MKRVLAFCMMVLLFCSCSSDRSYPFENRGEPIESIELLYYPWINNSNEEFMQFRLIRELEKDEISAFMDQVYELETACTLGEPFGNYGAYIAKVNYENGDTEYLGTHHIELVKAGDTPGAVGIYFFKTDAFEKLFSEYAW